MIDQNRPHRIAGLGLPLLDFITPSQEEFDKGGALIAETPVTGNAPQEVLEAKAKGAEHIAEAKQALGEFMAFFKANHFDEGEDKKTLTSEQAEQVASWFETMLVAARDIKQVAHYIKEDHRGLNIRFIGGSMANKFHTIQSGMAGLAQTTMLGVVGKDDEISHNKTRILKDVKDSRIHFEQLVDEDDIDPETHAPKPIELDRILASFIVPTAKGRVALKAPPPARIIQKFEKTIPQINAFVRRDDVDTYFIEGSDLSDRKFGASVFSAFADEAMRSGKPIVFSCPTDTTLVLGDSTQAKHNRRQLFTIMEHPTTDFIACNESEAVAMFCNETFDEDLIKNKTINPMSGKAYTMQDHPQVQQALHAIQSLLQQKILHPEPGAIEPVAFVSVGPEGGYAVSATEIHFSPAIPVDPKKFAGTIGAGDAFFSGCWMAHHQKMQTQEQLVEDGDVRRFSREDLQDMLHLGQRIAHDVVEYKGAQLPAKQIGGIVNGTETPFEATFAGIIPPPEPEKGVFK